MAYKPTESLDVTWYARNASWRRINTNRRDVVINLPVGMRNLSVDDLPQTDAGRIVRSWLLRWGAFPTSGLAPYDRGVGLLLTGPNGTGKTTMVSTAAQYLSDLGWSTKFIRAQDYYSLGIQAMRTADDEEQERLQSAFDCYAAGWDGWRVMVLDDLGMEYSTESDWSENVIVNLLRARFTDGAPTLVTTNLSPADISNRYGAVLGDYIREAFWIVTVAGTSHRVGRAHRGR